MIFPHPQQQMLRERNQQDNEDLERTQKLPVMRKGPGETSITEPIDLEQTQKLPLLWKGPSETSITTSIDLEQTQKLPLLWKRPGETSITASIDLVEQTQKLPLRWKGPGETSLTASIDLEQTQKLPVIRKYSVKESDASRVASSRRPLFREKAMQQYRQRQEKSVPLRFVSPPIFICSWILLCLFLLAILLAWWAEVPTYATGSGVVLAQKQSNSVGNVMVAILLFLPATDAPQIHPGLPAQVQIGETGPQYSGTIERVEPGIISPGEARKRYMLDPTASQVIAQPSLAVIVVPKTPLLTSQYAGSLISAQVPIGSRRVLSLLPGFNQLIGG
jgi:hypothetical protein